MCFGVATDSADVHFVCGKVGVGGAYDRVDVVEGPALTGHTIKRTRRIIELRRLEILCHVFIDCAFSCRILYSYCGLS